MRFNLNDALSGLAVLRTTSGNAMCHRAAPYPRESYAFEIHGLPCDLCGDTVHLVFLWNALQSRPRIKVDLTLGIRALTRTRNCLCRISVAPSRADFVWPSCAPA